MCNNSAPNSLATVQSFKSQDELRKALASHRRLATNSNRRGNNFTAPISSGIETVSEENEATDWLLPVPDRDARPQTVDDEVARLWTLKSYLVLDAEKEAAFDRLTEEACAIFNVPTSNISLVDFGRQFAFSNTGTPGDVRETSRKIAFCAHTILSKKGICVVNDTLQDERFCRNTLVINPPHLRFYAGAPLISPEGHNLGTFCVEGPEPRPEGLTRQEQDTLINFARQTMDLLVTRRERLQQQVYQCESLKRHAAVATNLGGHLYRAGECVAAMKLYQESVQALMVVEHEAPETSCKANTTRREKMADLMRSLSDSNELSLEESQPLIEELLLLVPTETEATDCHGEVTKKDTCKSCTMDGIPGLFSNVSKLKWTSHQRPLSVLVFGEPFTITLDTDPSGLPAEEKQFMIPIGHTSKATLFNMGLIHYHWNSVPTAMQFFDLASSLSNVSSPLSFDPVMLGCLNNMAQIHLQYGRPSDALELLQDALTRGNTALANLYNNSDHDDVSVTSNSSCPNHDVTRTRRLRRKLARTVMNWGQAYYSQCDYATAMSACQDAMRLLHTCMEESEVAAIWYNMGILYHHQGHRSAALQNINMFILKASQVLGPDHVQIADAYHKQGCIMFELGDLYSCIKPLNAAMRIRILHYGPVHGEVAESLRTIGKVLQAREEYDFALNAFQRSLDIEQQLVGGKQGLSFDSAQTLLDVGRLLHVQGNTTASLKIYQQVLELTRKFFGDRHPFVARIDKIIGNLYLDIGDVDNSVEKFTEATKIQLENGITMDLAIVQDRLCRVDLPKDNGVAPSA